VIAVPLGKVLHLKSAVTALPDGTFLLLPQLVPAGLFPAVRPVEEEGGCHVVPLGGDRVLIAASAPRTAGLLGDLGFTRSPWTSANPGNSKGASPASACCGPEGDPGRSPGGQQADPTERAQPSRQLNARSPSGSGPGAPDIAELRGVASAHAYAQVSMIIRCRQPCRKYPANRLT
jgi:hypothetical protein